MKMKLATTLALTVALNGCGDNILDWRNATVSGGKIYAGKDNEPFTGTLSNIPESSLPFNAAFNDLLVLHNRSMERIAQNQQSFFGSRLICDTSVEKGYVSGKTSCRDAVGVTRWKASIDGKGLDGEAAIFDITGQTAITKGEYSKGVLDGKLLVISPETKKPVGEYQYKLGKADGEFTQWDEKTGNKTYHVTTKNGDRVGLLQEWSPAGRLVGEIPYSGGFVNGEVKVWSAESGALTNLTTYVQGNQLGRKASWRADGTVIEDGNVGSDGKFISAESTSVEIPEEEDEWTTAVKPQNKRCVDSWVAYTHKQYGEDTIINLDSMKEWDGMCSSGQRPPA